MRQLNDILIVLSSVLLAAQLWGYYVHFRRVGAPTWRMRLMAGAFMAAYAVQLWALWPARALPWSAWLAAPVYCAGLALWVWAIQTSGRGQLSLAFSGDMPQVIIRGGPYRYVRHPFYAAYMLHWLAGFVATLNWAVAAAGIAAAAMCVIAAAREERRFARSNLGAAYGAYRAGTAMFVPFLKRPDFK